MDDAQAATWFDQFGTSGCVGCGRCITWCPVGIDITEEVAAIRATDGAADGGHDATTRSMSCSRTSPRSSGLDAEHLELIAGCATNVRFDAGAYLFREGDAADVLLPRPPRPGRARDLRAGPRPADHRDVGEGEVLGWSWLFPPYRWHFDARALEPARAIAFDGVPARKCEEDHDLGYELMRRFAPVMRRPPAGDAAAAARCLWQPGAAERRRAAGPMVPEPFRVAARAARDTHDTWTLELEPATARAAPASRPGQFNMLYAFGVGEVPISISGDPGRRGPLVHTIRAVGAVTARVCARASRATCSACAARSAAAGRSTRPRAATW